MIEFSHYGLEATYLIQLLSFSHHFHKADGMDSDTTGQSKIPPAQSEVFFYCCTLCPQHRGIL